MREKIHVGMTTTEQNKKFKVATCDCKYTNGDVMAKDVTFVIIIGVSEGDQFLLKYKKGRSC